VALECVVPINFVVKLAITAAMYAAQTAITASKRIYGPRLESTKVSTAEYGTPWTRGWARFRIEGAPVIAAADLVEHKHSHKGKGGTQVTYEYFASWMNGLADVQCDAVAKILFDKHLIYQSTGVGPTSLATASGFTGQMRIHLGAEDQLPDPWYQAWREARNGPNSTPAMRGRTTVVFENVNVSPFGNRIPQVTAELLRSSVPAYLWERFDTSKSNGSTFVVSGTWMAYYASAGIEWWDLATRTRLGVSGDVSSIAVNVDLAQDGTAYSYGGYVSGVDIQVALWVTPPLGPSSVIDCDGLCGAGWTRVFDIAGTRTVLGAQASAGYYNNGLTGVPSVQTPRDFFVDDEGTIWAVTQPGGSSNQFGLLNIGTGELTVFTGLASLRSDITQARACFVSSTNSFFVTSDGWRYIIDRDTMTITSSGTTGYVSSGDFLPVKDPTRTTTWVNFSEYSLEDGSLIRTVSGFSQPSNNHRRVYDPINHAMIVRPQFESRLYWDYLDRVGAGGVTWGDVIGEVCGWIGVTADVSELTQECRGYQMTQGDARAIVEPILDLLDVDAVPHGFTTLFRVRGDTPTPTVQVGSLVREAGAQPYTALNGPETDHPQRITLTFADPNADLQKNTASFARDEQATTSQRITTIDLSTVVLEPDEAKGMVDRFGMRQWNERGLVNATAFTLQQLATEPGDVLWLMLDEVPWSVRLTKWTLQQGRIAVEFKRDDPSLHDESGLPGAPMDGHTPEAIVVPVPSLGGVIDTTLLDDGDNAVNPLVYFWAGPYVSGGSFPGGVVYEYDADSGDYEELGTVESSQAATWGVTTGALGNVATPWLWDRGSSLTVTLLNGSLTGCTEAEAGADATLNEALVGKDGRWETIQFTNAVNNGDGTWTISNFLRGRRGTEWACGLHQAGDTFILASALRHAEIGLSAVGVSSTFKEQTIGRNPEVAAATSLTFTGASLKPYAPARIGWTTDGTDLTGTIIRRTRIGGAWVGGTTIPLGETSEAYEVDVYHGSTFKRTIAVTGTNTFTYTAAQMAADGNSVGSPPPVNLYQISDSVGRGYALAA
jgi:hypothetical protein